ncbi:hypothetical protein HAN_1g117 (nucleomorph) [Hemiselmis andersenii]|uniref:Uncharacterized protein n=1 Tax=Hemiselmis andersenii TaxID=464988 RepID=A9BKC4_HEMAN|nr:hypothetical protein HAN_1g117 [Hemiselmis andersenii]ABW97957.1 hypothetical protein HAN_1g117 [Hemiselmis andersenii]
MLSFFSLIGNKTNFSWKKTKFFEKFCLIFYFDNFFRLWNPNFFALKTKRYLGHNGIILKFCGSKKANNLITCSNDNFIKFWDVFSSRPLRSIHIKFDIIQCISLNKYNQILVCLGKETVSLWDVYTGNCFNSFSFSPQFPPSIMFLKNSDVFCVLQTNNWLVFFDLKSGSILKKFNLKRKHISVQKFSNSNLFFFLNKSFIFFDIEKFHLSKKFFLFPWVFKEKNIFEMIFSENLNSKKLKTKKVLKFFKKENFIRIFDINTSLFLLNN